MMAEKKNEGPDEQVAVTGRAVDVAGPNTTFADRAKARAKVKKVDADDEQVADKQVSSASTKRTARKS